MNIEQLTVSREVHRQALLQALFDFVKANGEPFSDYYRNEHGINDEEDEDVTVTHVLDTSEFGCYFPLPLQVNNDDIDKAEDIDNDLYDAFELYCFWSFYIVKDNKTGSEELKYYEFYNSGIKWSDEDSEPDHSSACDLSLAKLDYIITAIKLGLAERKFFSDDEK